MFPLVTASAAVVSFLNVDPAMFADADITEALMYESLPLTVAPDMLSTA